MRRVRSEWNPTRWNTWAWGWFLTMLGVVLGVIYIEDAVSVRHTWAGLLVAYITTVALDHGRGG